MIATRFLRTRSPSGFFGGAAHWAAQGSCRCDLRRRRAVRLSRLIYLKREGLREFGMDNETDLVELCTVRYTVPKFFIDRLRLIQDNVSISVIASSLLYESENARYTGMLQIFLKSTGLVADPYRRR